MINTLYDFFKSKNQALPSVDERAKTYNLGSDYRGTAEQNNALLARLKGEQTPAPVAQSGMPSTTATTPTSSPVPVATPPKAQSDALTRYLSSIEQTPEEAATANALTELEGATRMGVSNLEGQGRGIPLNLIRGQQAKLNEQGQLQQQTLRQKLANLQAKRQSAIDVSKTLLSREDAENKALAEAKKEAQTAKLESEKPFTLSEGQVRYDARGNIVASGAPKTFAPKSTSSGSSTPKGTYTSGGLMYTPQMGTEDSQELEASRGGDGYVDPTVYQNLYNAWIAAGGTAKGFTTYYPPKNYVNPANTWLPKVLMPTSTATKKTSSSSGREL